MSVWDWIIEYRHQAVQEQNMTKWRLFRLAAFDALDQLQTDPDRAIAMLEEAQTLAESLNESWWVLFCEHWKIQALLHYKRDYQLAQKLAVKAAVETRKPEYAHFPQRVCLHEDLISTYVNSDPNGYASTIEKAFDYMEQEIAPHMECRHCFYSLRVSQALNQEQWTEAEERASKYLSVVADSEEEKHHICSAYGDFCEIAFAKKDWETLAELAPKGEELAIETDRQILITEFLGWQLLCARQQGQETKAKQLLTKLEVQRKQLKSMPPSSYYRALSTYYELDDDLDNALVILQEEYSQLKGRGQTIIEFYCLRTQCELLRKMGQPLDNIMAEAQTVAQHLKDPTPYLKQLAEIAGN